MGRWHSIAWVAAVLAAGCGRLGYDAEGAGSDADADADTSSDGAVVDGAVGFCIVGNTLTGISATNASPIDPLSACNVDNALAEDGAVAGLDGLRFSGDPMGSDCTRIDPNVDYFGCGCVSVDLGAIYPIASATVRVGAVGDACGRACGSGLCGSGHTAPVYVSTIQGDYQFSELVRLSGSNLADYQVQINRPARYIMVCRDAWSIDRDDIVVDAITATCQ